MAERTLDEIAKTASAGCEKFAWMGTTNVTSGNTTMRVVQHAIQCKATNAGLKGIIERVQDKANKGGRTPFSVYAHTYGVGEDDAFPLLESERIVLIVCENPANHDRIRTARDDLKSVLGLLQNGGRESYTIDVFTDIENPLDGYDTETGPTLHFNHWRCTPHAITSFFTEMADQANDSEMSIIMITGSTPNKGKTGKEDGHKTGIGIQDICLTGGAINTEEMALLICGLRLKKMTIVADFCHSAALCIALLPRIKCYDAKAFDELTSSIGDYLYEYYLQVVNESKRNAALLTGMRLLALCDGKDPDDVRLEDVDVGKEEGPPETRVVSSRPTQGVKTMVAKLLAVATVAFITNAVFEALFVLIGLGDYIYPLTDRIGFVVGGVIGGSVALFVGCTATLILALVMACLCIGVNYATIGWFIMVSTANMASVYIGGPVAWIIPSLMTLFAMRSVQQHAKRGALRSAMGTLGRKIMENTVMFTNWESAHSIVCTTPVKAVHYLPPAQNGSCFIYNPTQPNSSRYLLPDDKLTVFNAQANAFFTCDRALFVTEKRDNCDDYAWFVNGAKQTIKDDMFNVVAKKLLGCEVKNYSPFRHLTAGVDKILVSEAKRIALIAENSGVDVNIVFLMVFIVLICVGCVVLVPRKAREADKADKADKAN
jgi:hypothetical protein